MRSWPCPTGRNNRRASIGRLITARYAHAASLKARPHTAAIARQRSHGPVSVTKSLIIIVQGKSRVASPSYTSHRGHYLLMPRTATLRKSVVHWRGQPQRFPYLLIFPSPFYSTESFHISSPLSTILISNRGELKIFNYEKRRIVNYLFELYIRKKNWIGGG